MLTLIASAVLFLAHGDKVVVELQQTAKVRGTRIQLQDVAVVKSQDGSLKDQLLALDLGPRPEGAWVRTIDSTLVRRAAQQAGVPAEALLLIGAGQSAVQSLHAVLRGEEVAACAEPALRSLLVRWGETDVEMRADPAPGELRVPPGRTGLELLAEPRESTVTRSGAIVDVEVRVDGETFRKIPVYMRLRRFREVLVAQAGIKADEPFTRDNVGRRRTEVTTLAFEPVADESMLQAKVAAHGLKAGQPITVEDVANPPIVRRGEIVTLVSYAGRVRISTRAVAQRDGVKDALIPVVSAASENKVVFARVDGPGTVVIGEKGK